MQRVAVFCGSSFGSDPAFREAAEALGSHLAEAGVGLVYGGGHVGLMGVLADAVMSAGGEVIGVIPRLLADREVAHTAITDLRVVETMHERKAQMADLSDGFVVLPGGLGTLEEIFEILTWETLGYHAKPSVFLDVDGFWAGLFDTLDGMARSGFITPEVVASINRVHRADDVLDALGDR